MSEPVEIVLEFRCRRCGSPVEVRSASPVAEETVGTIRWHQCPDGGTGAADFTGFRPVSEPRCRSCGGPIA